MSDMEKLKPLVQAINTASRRIAMERQSLAYGAGYNGTVGGKREQAWKDYGFPNTLNFNDFINLYQRNSLAHAIVHRITEKSWQDEPWLVQGQEADNAKTETPWEREFRQLAKRLNLWQKFQDADRRRLVGMYSGLILQVAEENPNWDREIESQAELVNIIPAWQGQLTPGERDTDQNSQTYGKVLVWNYQESAVDGPEHGGVGRSINIHHSRIVIIGDEREGVPLLEAAYNDFVSLEKVMGALGESYWKNAARQLNFQYDKETSPQSLADAAGVKVEDLGDALNDMVADLNQGLDAGAFSFGGKAVPLVATVPPPQEPYTVLAQNICASAMIPMKIAVGNQTGERASTEDQEDFNNRCQGRRKSELTHDITRFIAHLIEYSLIPPVPEFTVMWTDLAEASLSDKLDNVKKMAEVNQLMTLLGGVYSQDEMREMTGHEPLAVDDLPAGYGGDDGE